MLILRISDTEKKARQFPFVNEDFEIINDDENQYSERKLLDQLKNPEKNIIPTILNSEFNSDTKRRLFREHNISRSDFNKKTIICNKAKVVGNDEVELYCGTTINEKLSDEVYDDDFSWIINMDLSKTPRAEIISENQ